MDELHRTTEQRWDNFISTSLVEIDRSDAFSGEVFDFDHGVILWPAAAREEGAGTRSAHDQGCEEGFPLNAKYAGARRQVRARGTEPKRYLLGRGAMSCKCAKNGTYRTHKSYRSYRSH